MRPWLALVMALVSCGAPPVDDESCEGVDFSCDCPNGEAFASCVDGELFCDCVSGPGDPPGSGGSELGSGGADEEPASGGQASGGSDSGGEPGSGGEPASGGETGGTESGGSSSGGESSGGSESGGSGGDITTGGAPSMCDSSPCLGSGSREYYCGGDPGAPECTACVAGWCNCSQGPSYEPGNGLGEACETKKDGFPGYTCSVICQYCIDDPSACP